MSQNLPNSLGKYQVIREIARSNDIVYEGHDPIMNRRVALKELAVNSSWTSTQKEDRIRRFEREVKAAGSLQHPGIVTIFEFGEDGEHIYMAMEYLDGRTLRQEIEAKGFIPEKRAVEIVIEVLEALQYAHENGVVHRDIKPENIQIISSGKVKLTDFGIARLTYEPNLTMDGQVFGTPSFMSPEQVQGKDVDARTDIWAVGAVLYEAMTGQKAFEGDSIVSISYAIMNTEPDPSPQISYGVNQVLRQALERNLVLRYASAKDMIEGLNEVLNGYLTGVTNVIQPQFGNYMGIPGASAPAPIMPGAPPIQSPASYSYGYAPVPQSPYLAPVPIIVPRKRVQFIKPSTRRFLVRFLGIVVTVGLVLALVTFGVDSMLKAVEKVLRGQIPAGPASSVPQSSGSSGSKESNATTSQPSAQSENLQVGSVGSNEIPAVIEQGFSQLEMGRNSNDSDEAVKLIREGCKQIQEGLKVLSPGAETMQIRRRAFGYCSDMMDRLIAANFTKDARTMGYLALEFSQDSKEMEASIRLKLEGLGA